MSRVIENPKQLILSKAKEILYNEGFAKLSMRNLSKACDIALGTIYNYYPTKKELVVDMMTDYWHEYFYRIECVSSSDCSIYEKLNRIYDELKIFIETFKTVWLKPELYDHPEYIADSMERENTSIERLISFVNSILIKEINDNKIQSKLDPYELSKFIVMNFITIIQMPTFKYSSFEAILKELIKVDFSSTSKV
jgi:AcrR family transcriptional regulator